MHDARFMSCKLEAYGGIIIKQRRLRVRGTDKNWEFYERTSKRKRTYTRTASGTV